MLFALVPDLVLDPDLLRAHQLVFCGMAGMLTILHLGLLAFRPRQRENLHCAWFAASYALVIYSNFELDLATSPGAGLVHARLFLAATALATVAWLTTTRALLLVRDRSALVTTVTALVGGVGLWGMISPGKLPYLALLLVVTVVSAIVTSWIVAASRRGVPGVGVVGTGMLLLAGAVIYSILRSVGLAPGGQIGIYLPTYGGICAAVSLSLLVARNFAIVSTRLEAELAEVERLSAAALAGERAQQAFIAAKNTELEETVALRTAELRAARDKSDSLLYNILPREVADELKTNGHTLPRRYDDVTVLFTDFEGFTNTVAVMPPDRLITELNDIFARFDDIIDRHGLQKIKTIGDAYLAAAGLPAADPAAAARAVDAALELATCIETRNHTAAIKWHMRIGLHSGTVVAGVIGKRRLIYDIFGDTVNIASRIQTHATPGSVNLSAYTCDLVRARHHCNYRGKIEVKGKGGVDMYCVVPPASP